jgi:hypothetical protein
MACFRKVSLDSPASLWAESIYGNRGTFTAPAWDDWKTNFLGQFMNPNELQAAQAAFNDVRMNARGTDVLAFNEAFRAAAVRLDCAYKANELVLDGDQLAVQYLTKLTGAVSIHVNSVVNINAAANRKGAGGGNPSIKLTMQHLMSEAVQHQKDVSLQNVGEMGSTSCGKGPTPMDLNVIQTTAGAGADSTVNKLNTMQTDIETTKAELNAFWAEFRGRKNFQLRRKDTDEEKEPFKCYNCGGAGHMARHCSTPKKKEAGKAQDQ